MTFAPIALFVYRRPEHTRRTITSLQACPEFDQSPMIVYSDGPRDAAAEPGVAATRAVVHDMLPHARIIEAPANRGLAASIIAGVDALTAEFGKVIVVEDDLVVELRFLEFLNAALDRYADVPRVMQVSGFQHDVAGLAGPVLLPLTTSWGWATWRRAWQRFDPECAGAARLASDPATARRFDLDGAMPYTRMLARQLAGTIDSWAIRWYWTLFVNDGLGLFPPSTLVVNEGFDGSGTHGVASVRPTGAPRRGATDDGLLTFPSAIAVDRAAFDCVRAAARRDFGRSNTLAVKVVRLLAAKLRALTN